VAVALDLPSGRAPYLDEHNAHGARIPFSELVDRIERGERCYLHQAPLERFEGLVDEIDLSALTAIPRYGINLWVGGQTRSGLHFDSADNVLVQVYGRKQAVLVAPKYVRALCVLPDVPSKSGLSPDEIEAEGDGRLSRIERWRTTLEPGDALFIPRGWWHYLASPGASISINNWHGDRLPVKDHLAAFFRAGPRTWGRTVRDFAWCGMLGRPYQQRLFSPPALGVDLYRRLARRRRR
jgi:lysine-specific demethylase 8